MTKQDFINVYGLKQAEFTTKLTRKQASKKELATLKALCKTKTLGLVADIDDTVNVDAVNTGVDYKLAHRGTAQEHTLISVWSRNNVSHVTKKADYRDFGVRLHADVYENFEQFEAFKELVSEKTVQVYSEKNGFEVRYTFKSLADAIKFVADIADATATEQAEQEQEQTTEQSKEIATEQEQAQ